MKKLFVALLLVLLAQPLPAQAQEVEPSNVWLPLVSNQEAKTDPDIPIGGCKFNTIPTGDGDWEIWIEVTKGDPVTSYRMLDIYWKDNRDRTIHDSLPYVYSLDKFLSYQSQVAEDVIALIWEGEPFESDYQVYCELVVNPSAAKAVAIPNPVADPPAVPGLFLWTWVNWKIDKETHEGFSLSCQAWADKLWVYALILNQDTGKTTERLVHRDETGGIIHEVSCNQSEALVVYEPELLMSVRFETDIDTAVTVERKDFRWLAWLPFIESN